ncbi:hypothetical protein P175DRAFT_0521456 [Aspergillus ochraceoroseus IBT 24754]|uniref:Zn(2)-C6 fungal-type domain-containing protein n=2 Tax=Aspergillus ochraceoroseus TaxID=138278 RepID=A0A2T5M157_9EURO|nr:uncharacterized protein P175DRAFT_0521456 [Aspergillus ochraceoroseus IBT 24754]KKK21927.1 hypothetical protein AOCH_000184 [Aspergillus ochraceoroseus]PTU22272.1 hypothetical protein P175DRAFT_0521456 [Aspergillus ochraceoroseus IBT 24754]
MGRRRTACAICASLKTQCLDGRPCSRCRRLNLPCTDAQANRATAASMPVLKSRKKVSHTRSAMGCSNCRRRRKKCDENWPICGDCSRLSLRCSPPVCVEPTHSASPTELAQAEYTITPSADIATGLILDPTFNRISLTSWDAMRDPSSSFSVLPKPFAEWVNLICSDNDVGMVKMANLANSTASKNLTSSHLGGDGLEQGVVLPSAALCKLTCITPLALQDWDIAQRHLLNHFVQTVSRALVAVPDDRNIFLRTLVPMALTNRAVRFSLTTLSACHISNVYPEWQRDVMMLQGLALEGLKAELQSPSRLSYALVATLLLCLTEICQGTSQKWLLHLHGAKALLDSVDDYSLGLNAALMNIIDVYNYLCCAASTTSDDVPATIERESLNERGGVSENNDEAQPLVFGIPEELYRLLNRANFLAAKGRHDGCDMEEIREIERMVKRWKPGRDLSESSEEQAAAIAMQTALLMLLQQRRERLANDDPMMRKMASDILVALSQIRPGSPLEARILFPIFMAGVGSMKKSNRLTVEYRLNMMATKGLGNVFVTLKLLDDIWRRANRGDIVDWEVLLRSEYPGLVFA